MVSYAKWGIINLVIAGYLMFFIVYFWDDWDYSDIDSCVADLSWWVTIYFGLQIVHIVRKIICIIIWKKADDPTIACTKVDLIAIPCLYLPELCWYIYGNTLVYN